jgi:hypothetical protein
MENSGLVEANYLEINEEISFSNDEHFFKNNKIEEKHRSKVGLKKIILQKYENHKIKPEKLTKTNRKSSLIFLAKGFSVRH